jgi:hypothetical protein
MVFPVVVGHRSVFAVVLINEEIEKVMMGK